MTSPPDPRRRRVALIAAAILLLAGASRPLARTARLLWSRWNLEFERAQNPGLPDSALPSAPPKPAEPPPPAPLPAPVITPPADYTPPPPQVRPPGGPPKPSEPPKSPPAPDGPRVASRPPEPPPAGGGSAGRPAIRVYGVVFGLLSLEPAVSARVSFHGPGGAYDTTTDRDGRYLVDLPAAFVEGGVLVDVAADGWREGQIEDATPTYLERSAAQRRAAAAELGPTDLDAVRLAVRPNAAVFPLDLVLLRPESPKKSR